MKYTRNSNEVKNLIESVSIASGFQEKVWMSMSRLRELVIVRQLFYYILRKQIKLTLKNCGSILNQDHSTVIHAIEAVEHWLGNPKLYSEENNLYNHIMMEYGTRNQETIYVDSDGGIWRRQDPDGSNGIIEKRQVQEA